ncbi:MULTISPECIES: hypothetical protein [unclassified Streptomyces]|uniref:hypothetical protein n=1 Tax=unclassified Streptomyces TaxID=2593676 RepID=UPI003C7D1418
MHVEEFVSISSASASGVTRIAALAAPCSRSQSSVAHSAPVRATKESWKSSKKPDAVYHSTGGAGNLIFRQGDDIVVAKGGSEAGQAVTAYGPSGVKGDSGAAALGGKATDPGRPVTHEDIVQGKIPGRDGYMPPAVKLKPEKSS